MTDLDITLYTWAWKFMIFFVLNPWAMILVVLTACCCVGHFISLLVKAQRNERTRTS